VCYPDNPDTFVSGNHTYDAEYVQRQPGALVINIQYAERRES
jgi:hypothetical protein